MDAIDVCGPPFLPQANHCKNQSVYSSYKRQHPRLLELPPNLSFSEFPAAVSQLAENTAQKHSSPVLISKKHIFTFF